MVYLICFHKPYKHARHYIGFTETQETFEKRIAQHRKGSGARLLEVITKAGIGFDVVRTWANGSRNFERTLKNRKNASKLCPNCKARPTVLKSQIHVDCETGGLDGQIHIAMEVKKVEDSYGS